MGRRRDEAVPQTSDQEGMGSAGSKTVAKVKRRCEWLYLYGFVRPKGDEVHWLILPKVNMEVFSVAPEHSAKEVGSGNDTRILLVLDRAGCTPARRLRPRRA